MKHKTAPGICLLCGKSSREMECAREFCTSGEGREMEGRREGGALLCTSLKISSQKLEMA
jgi:hypothetical protein